MEFSFLRNSKLRCPVDGSSATLGGGGGGGHKRKKDPKVPWNPWAPFWCVIRCFSDQLANFSSHSNHPDSNGTSANLLHDDVDLLNTTDLITPNNINIASRDLVMTSFESEGLLTTSGENSLGGDTDGTEQQLNSLNLLDWGKTELLNCNVRICYKPLWVIEDYRDKLRPFFCYLKR